jgi:hypothetical protein
MEQLLTAFFAHPTVAGAVMVISVAFVYGIIKLTSAATRGAIALEGIRVDFAKAHTESRDEMRVIGARVTGLESRLDVVKVDVIKAVDTSAGKVVEELRDRRLSELAAKVESVSEPDQIEARGGSRSVTGTGRHAAIR